MGVNRKQAGYRDLIGEIHARGTGANDPIWTTSIINGLAAFKFSSVTMTQVWVNFHIPHDYAPGSVIYLHAHWISAGTNTGNVRWQFEYSYAKGYDQQAFPATTTVGVTQANTATANQHHIAEIAVGDAIPSTNIETDGVIWVRAFRDPADAADTCTDDVYLLYVDCHYMSDRLTTPNKNFPFF